MEKILETIKDELPSNAMISEIRYEGCEIILYTKNAEFFKHSTEMIKKIVNKIKKRIEVRADPSMVADEEKTTKFIKNTVPKEAELRDIFFEPEFAKVIIHAQKPGLVIGKNGDLMRSLKEETLWTPEVKRAPVIDSAVIKQIRKMLHQEADYRKKFLHKLGEKIYSETSDVEYIRTTFLGGFREVGRSCILLQTSNSNALLDCGISVGNPDSPFPLLESPEFQIQKLDAVVISHPHMDHCGFVPFLYEHGFKGPCYATRPTRDLSALLQLDYLGICQRENNKAPYTSKGIEEMIKHCITLDYGEVTDITPDVRLTLENAGHLLGSSLVHLNIGNGFYNILYTSDMKYNRTRLFDPASTNFTRVEGMIIESTYGSEARTSYTDAQLNLIENIRKIIDKDGRVLIPSFAVGRAQEIIAILADTNIDVPIFLDGMIWDATAIHTAYPEFMNKNIQTKILHKGKNPFIDERLKTIGSSKEREEVLEKPGPYVIISTSGMLTGGPALNYLKEFADDPKNGLIFVGYQGEGTLGRRIQKGWTRVQLSDGTDIELKLQIMTTPGLGGHSDQKELIAFTSHLQTKPRKILINHGESKNTIELAKALHKNIQTETTSPRNLETIRFK
jgi:hypothetical protein